MKALVLCYQKCTTCQKALRWLDGQGIEYTLRPIKEENPTAEEIAQWHKQSGLPLKRFFNTSGLLYKEMGLAKRLPELSEEEQISLLATDGMLVRRPLVLWDTTVLAGFSPDAWQKALVK